MYVAIQWETTEEGLEFVYLSFTDFKSLCVCGRARVYCGLYETYNGHSFP